MWDFSISTALGIMRKTAPFLAFRILVYFGIVSMNVSNIQAQRRLKFCSPRGSAVCRRETVRRLQG